MHTHIYTHTHIHTHTHTHTLTYSRQGHVQSLWMGKEWTVSTSRLSLASTGSWPTSSRVGHPWWVVMWPIPQSSDLSCDLTCICFYSTLIALTPRGVPHSCMQPQGHLKGKKMHTDSLKGGRCTWKKVCRSVDIRPNNMFIYHTRLVVGQQP